MTVEIRPAERSVAGLWDAIGRLIDRFTPQECQNLFHAAGYQPICSDRPLNLRKENALSDQIAMRSDRRVLSPRRLFLPQDKAALAAKILNRVWEAA
ncbi:hypothetical protein [Xanthobacter autotrophicus]|uniref:hypothetical protein n=1 Tax=Xanthobacter autotrophicus TaxID=280 RepID=UPI00372D5B76